MPYSQDLAARIREALVAAGEPTADERKMFGGLTFMVGGNFCVGVIGDELVARLGTGGDALNHPHVRPMDFTGRPMKGWVYVAQPAIADDDGLRAWVGRCLAFNRTLPRK